MLYGRFTKSARHVSILVPRRQFPGITGELLIVDGIANHFHRMLIPHRKIARIVWCHTPICDRPSASHSLTRPVAAMPFRSENALKQLRQGVQGYRVVEDDVLACVLRVIVALAIVLDRLLEFCFVEDADLGDFLR